MPTRRNVVQAYEAGGMNDFIDSAQHGFGMLKEMRNVRFRDGSWTVREGWAKSNTLAMPWETAIGIFAYRTTREHLRILVVGGDGNIYHDVDNFLAPVELTDAVVWDSTYRAKFCAWKDDCLITIGSVEGVQTNLRYDGRLGRCFGVNFPGPAAAPLLVDVGVGNVRTGVYDYYYTFYDNPPTGTTTESMPSPISQIDLTGVDNRTIRVHVQAYGGTGRTIHRRIYRRAQGGEFNLVHTIDNNAALWWDDSVEIPAGGVAYLTERIPVCRYVSLNANGVPVWCNDVENNEPATIYISSGPDRIESIALDALGVLTGLQQAGGHDDPITGPYSVRDGVIIAKRRSIHYLPRECELCERLISNVGCVAAATMQSIGSSVVFLSDEGPRVIDHGRPEDVRFIGSNPRRFDLAEWWETVQKDRLQYACSVHFPSKSIIVWFVQCCRDSGCHNDTAIVWHYAMPSMSAEGWGIVSLDDVMVDAACSGEEVPWGAFPGGFVGPLYHGYHGDGVPEVIDVMPTAVEGKHVWIDEGALATPLVDDGWKGSVFHVHKGAGSRACRPVVPCDRVHARIVGHELLSAGRCLELAEDIGADSTSVARIGGFNFVVHIGNAMPTDPDDVKNFIQTDIHIRVED